MRKCIEARNCQRTRLQVKFASSPLTAWMKWQHVLGIRRVRTKRSFFVSVSLSLVCFQLCTTPIQNRSRSTLLNTVTILHAYRYQVTVAVADTRPRPLRSTPNGHGNGFDWGTRTRSVAPPDSPTRRLTALTARSYWCGWEGGHEVVLAECALTYVGE